MSILKALLDRVNKIQTRDGIDPCWIPKKFPNHTRKRDNKFAKGNLRTFGHTPARYVFSIFNGSIGRNGDCVCHLCDQPKCLNPKHLFLGSQSDNMKDAANKGRMIHGEKHPCAKLTEDAVLDIRSSEESYETLGRKYNVKQNTIRNAACGRTWKHVGGKLKKDNHKSRVPWKTVKKIRKLYKQGIYTRYIAKELNMNSTTVLMIAKNKTYKNKPPKR